MNVVLREDHFKEAKKLREYSFVGSSCPIALALKEKLKKYVWVYPDRVNNSEFSFEDSPRLTSEAKEVMKSFDNEQDCSKFYNKEIKVY